MAKAKPNNQVEIREYANVLSKLSSFNICAYWWIKPKTWKEAIMKTSVIKLKIDLMEARIKEKKAPYAMEVRITTSSIHGRILNYGIGN